MKDVIAYCRVSTDGQVGEDKFGIDSQKAIISDYCAAHDMRICSWYIDAGISGVKESRPQLDAILFGDISNPPIEAVVVAKSDRIARDIKLYYYFMMLLEKRGMKLISATEEVVNDDTGLGNVYKALMLFVAEQERQNITKRTTGGRMMKASAGGYAGGRTPYGYIARDRQMAINESEADVVRLIFSLRSEGRTIKEISAYLTAEGYMTRNGKPFAQSTVFTILDNKRTYQGYYKYGENSQWVRGQHTPILPETVDEAMTRLGDEE